MQDGLTVVSFTGALTVYVIVREGQSRKSAVARSPVSRTNAVTPATMASTALMENSVARRVIALLNMSSSKILQT